MSEYGNAAAPEELESLHAEALEAEVVDEGHGEPEAEPQGLGGEACAALAGTVFELVAMRRGEHWRLNNEESQAFGNALDAVLQKYAPQVGNVGPEASLLLVTAAVLMPRIQKDRAAQTDET